MTQKLIWTWLSTEPRFEKTIKKTSFNVKNVKGIQIWRNSHGFCRLVAKIDGRLYASSIHFLTIAEAEEAANVASN
ncbi:hypothetical protein HUN41_00210 [Streptomyces phage Coruscant]|uniref:Uncharacterized protein n=1 Tax=Streptomyces phage Coruscant TaxID=2739834 RepID=A0A7G4AWB3_9CAUD|nr:hypothetical protein PP454_gp114 [Streptomyces phage Coruscant]QMP84303.1 hypothetical protein HUN41_00210 [Streptomyces phage Coruscant]